MSRDIDRIEIAIRFVGAFIIDFSSLMPMIVVLYRTYTGLSDADSDRAFLGLRDDAARLDEFRALIFRRPDSREKQALLVLTDKAIELCRFRAVLAHGILGGDRLHGDPTLIPNFFHPGAAFKKVILSESNMKRYAKQLRDVTIGFTHFLPKGIKIDIGEHSMIIEEFGGKSAESIFEDLGLPLSDRDTGGRRVSIKFVYSVSRTTETGAILQFHDRERIQKVSGTPDEYGMPTIRQLHIAERDFLDQWQHFEPNGYLLCYKTIPADGTRGLFSEYSARLSA